VSLLSDLTYKAELLIGTVHQLANDFGFIHTNSEANLAPGCGPIPDIKSEEEGQVLI
jgi:hypothetical protein